MILNQGNFKYSASLSQLQSDMDNDLDPGYEVDATYTVDELLYKYSAGGIAAVSGTGLVYDDDPDIDNPDPTIDGDFDLADYARIQTELNDRYEEKKRAKEEKQRRIEMERRNELARLRSIVNQGVSEADSDGNTR